MARKQSRFRRQRWVVYGLTEPVNHEIKYVGRTADMMGRYKMHLHESRKSAARGRSTAKESWIAGLLSRGLHPGIVILEATTSRLSVVAERKWVMLLGNGTSGLVNNRPMPEPTAVDMMRAIGINAKLHALVEIAAELLEKHGDPCAAIYRRQATAVINLTT